MAMLRQMERSERVRVGVRREGAISKFENCFCVAVKKGVWFCGRGRRRDVALKFCLGLFSWSRPRSYLKFLLFRRDVPTMMVWKEKSGT